jgi:hypothetical protein
VVGVWIIVGVTLLVALRAKFKPAVVSA